MAGRGGGSEAARAHDGEVALDVVLVRRQRGGAREALLGGRQRAALNGHHAQVVQRLHVVRLQLQDATVTLECKKACSLLEKLWFSLI